MSLNLQLLIILFLIMGIAYMQCIMEEKQEEHDK